MKQHAENTSKTHYGIAWEVKGIKGKGECWLPEDIAKDWCNYFNKTYGEGSHYVISSTVSETLSN